MLDNREKATKLLAALQASVPSVGAERARVSSSM
jgi:hypothetical protein